MPQLKRLAPTSISDYTPRKSQAIPSSSDSQAMVISSRYSNSRSQMVPNYTGPHGYRGFVRRRGKYYKRPSGPYALLGNGGARHQNPRYPAPESKIDDILPGSIAIPTTGSFATTGALNAIAQGVTNATRIGSKILIKSLAYRLDYDINAAATIPTAIRTIIFWDRQPNTYGTAGGSALAVTDLLSTASYLSFNNPANSDRFVVLRNENIALAPNGPQSAFLEGFVKINMNSLFLNTVTNEPTTGALGCLFISDAAANTPTVVSSFRTRYSDC